MRYPQCPEPGRLEEGPALALERVHVERLMWEVPIYVATVPDQALLPHAVVRHSQWEYAEQLRTCAGGHGAEADTFRNCGGDELRGRERGFCVRE